MQYFDFLIGFHVSQLLLNWRDAFGNYRVSRLRDFLECILWPLAYCDRNTL